MTSSKEEEIVVFGDNEVTEFAHSEPVPLYLKITYVVVVVWGVVWLWQNFDGSGGWIDRGSWHQLQKAANTTSETD